MANGAQPGGNSQSPPKTNRLTGTAGRPIAYDSAGNLTAWGTADYSYDPVHMMTWLETARSARTMRGRCGSRKAWGR